MVYTNIKETYKAALQITFLLCFSQHRKHYWNAVRQIRSVASCSCMLVRYNYSTSGLFCKYWLEHVCSKCMCVVTVNPSSDVIRKYGRHQRALKSWELSMLPSDWGEKVVLRLAKTDLFWAIKKTKLAYTRKIESKFCDSRDTGPM